MAVVAKRYDDKFTSYGWIGKKIIINMVFFKNEKKIFIDRTTFQFFFTVDIQLYKCTFGTIKIGTFNEHWVLLINSNIDVIVNIIFKILKIKNYQNLAHFIAVKTIYSFVMFPLLL